MGLAWERRADSTWGGSSNRHACCTNAHPRWGGNRMMGTADLESTRFSHIQYTRAIFHSGVRFANLVADVYIWSRLGETGGQHWGDPQTVTHVLPTRTFEGGGNCRMGTADLESTWFKYVQDTRKIFHLGMRFVNLVANGYICSRLGDRVGQHRWVLKPSRMCYYANAHIRGGGNCWMGTADLESTRFSHL